MAQEREIAARVGSLAEMAEIVAAIRAIAASQMQQALRTTAAIRSYSELIGKALSDALSLLPSNGTVPRMSGRNALVLFGAEHGLCGGFNQQLLRAVQHDFKEKAQQPVLMVVGSRA